MKRPSLLVLAIAALLPLGVSAHKQWIIPSQAVVNGNDVWVTFDGAVSNQLFFPDHVPMRLDNVTATAPDGSTVQLQNASTGKYRSTFDVQLLQQGTYRIANAHAGMSARWDTPASLAAKAAAQAQGKPVSGPGAPPETRGGFLRNASADDLATKVPKDAQNLQVTQTIGRVETFVTNGAPSETALAATGKGIELAPVTHPNDLVAGEEATFRVLVDGQPAAGLAFEIVRGGTRYRNAQEDIAATSDAEGLLRITWPEPGMYWLETSVQDDKPSIPQASQRRLSYVATLEVLPQ
ncbi:DUF4198 domain-containing protein [Luteimonas sp. SDU101]|uniref:DUF4198 domain-containing protein n=1 Tax=unclassified Luteimonas TaxID=2629088 RepID=UPI003EBD173D